jgi:hypothetical protein
LDVLRHFDSVAFSFQERRVLPEKESSGSGDSAGVVSGLLVMENLCYGSIELRHFFSINNLLRELDDNAKN